MTEDGRIYRSGRKKYPNGDAYSVRPADKQVYYCCCMLCVSYSLMFDRNIACAHNVQLQHLALSRRNRGVATSYMRFVQKLLLYVYSV